MIDDRARRKVGSSIAEDGVKQPLTVVFEGNKVWVIDGSAGGRYAGNQRAMISKRSR